MLCCLHNSVDFLQISWLQHYVGNFCPRKALPQQLEASYCALDHELRQLCRRGCVLFLCIAQLLKACILFNGFPGICMGSEISLSLVPYIDFVYASHVAAVPLTLGCKSSSIHVREPPA